MDETTLIPREKLLHLASLPPSGDLAEELEAAEREAGSSRLAFTSGRRVELARRRLDDGIERDHLASRRPKGCHCLGMGTVEQQLEYRYADIGRRAVVEFCACPEGIAAKEEADQRDRQWRADRVASLVSALNLMARFRAMTLDSHPNQAAANLVRGWVPTPEQCGLFLYGGFGTGKTGLAVGVVKAEIERSASEGMFTTTSDLLDAIRITYDREHAASENILANARAVPILALDDIGAERPTDWVREKLYQLINVRHGQQLTTIFTSNLPLDQLAENLGERTVWRIAEMCRVVRIDGTNLREPRR